MTDLATFRRLVRQRLGVPASDDFFTDVVLTDLVNQAVATVEEEHYWPWAQRTEVGTLTAGVVSKPTRWRATRALFTMDGTELGLVSITDLYASGQEAGGHPMVWADIGNDIAVSPVPPDGTQVRHVYYASPAPLLGEDDAADMPDSTAGAVVAKAAELGSAREDDQGAREAHAQDYSRWLSRMERSLRRSTGPLRVRVRPGGWT